MSSKYFRKLKCIPGHADCEPFVSKYLISGFTDDNVKFLRRDYSACF